jgi:hypothetical protein
MYLSPLTFFVIRKVACGTFFRITGGFQNIFVNDTRLSACSIKGKEDFLHYLHYMIFKTFTKYSSRGRNPFEVLSFHLIDSAGCIREREVKTPLEI